MNVIFNAANDEGLAIVFGQNAAKVAVQFFAQGFVAEKWTAIFGRENGVNQNLGEGLSHDAMMAAKRGGFNSFRVDSMMGRSPSVAASRQRWAE
jgi:hypothetical protein